MTFTKDRANLFLHSFSLHRGSFVLCCAYRASITSNLRRPWSSSTCAVPKLLCSTFRIIIMQVRQFRLVASLCWVLVGGAILLGSVEAKNKIRSSSRSWIVVRRPPAAAAVEEFSIPPSTSSPVRQDDHGVVIQKGCDTDPSFLFLFNPFFVSIYFTARVVCLPFRSLSKLSRERPSRSMSSLPTRSTMSKPRSRTRRAFPRTSSV